MQLLTSVSIYIAIESKANRLPKDFIEVLKTSTIDIGWIVTRQRTKALLTCNRHQFSIGVNFIKVYFGAGFFLNHNRLVDY